MKNLFPLSHIEFFKEMLFTAMEGIEWFFVAYLLCIIVFLVVGRPYLKTVFVYPFAFMAVTIFNPFLIVPVAHMIGLAPRFRRLFWLLPINVVLAFAFTFLTAWPPSKKQLGRFMKTMCHILGAACCIAFVVLLGTSVSPYMHRPQNIYKTSNEILSISAIIEEDSQAAHRKKSAVYADIPLMELRQFDPTIQNALGRKELFNWNLENTDEQTVEEIIRSGRKRQILGLVVRYGIPIDQKAFKKAAKNLQINYIITPVGMNYHDYFQQTGYEQIGTAGIYEIYRISSS